MELFDIFIAYISWESGGKNRPVLVLEKNDDIISVFSITTKFENKSKNIQEQYFKINDWDQAGLDKQSYIDTGKLFDIPLTAIDNKQPIGKLTTADMERLLEFLS